MENRGVNGLRVRGSSKMLQDEIIHEAINERYEREHSDIPSGDENDDDDEGGIVFAPKQSQSISGLGELKHGHLGSSL